MKGDTYSSIYDAKAHFSELLRKVQSKKRVIITNRGKPIAAIIPFAETEEGLEGRLRRMEEEGGVSRNAAPLDELTAIVRRKGALTRFFADRE
jgi:prevent-host-death family protein